MSRKVYKHKRAFVGTDQDGDSSIYIAYIDNDGTIGPYLSDELLQRVADRINRMRILKESHESQDKA